MLFNDMHQKHVCPRCFAANEDNIRIAQFGGATGGRPNAYSPGTSPAGQGGGSKNYGINDFGADKTIDSIISGSHNPPQIDEHRNIERRLEVYHQHKEEDMIPYWLTPEEREKLRIKKEVRRRNEWLEKSKHMTDTNAVSYIQRNFQPKPEHMSTLESQLINRHKYKPGDKSKYEDELPPVAKPERIHMAQTTTHGRTSPFDSTTDDEEEAAYPNFDNIRMKTPLGVGNAPTFDKGSELDEYLDKAYKADWGGLEGPNEPTLMDIPNADNIGNHSWGFGDKIPSAVHGEIDSDLDAFMPLEQQLESTKRQESPLRNPNDPFSYWSEYETAKGVGTPGEPLGFADKYSGGSFNPSPIPR
jgi:hypothetical protein